MFASVFVVIVNVFGVTWVFIHCPSCFLIAWVIINLVTDLQTFRFIKFGTVCIPSRCSCAMVCCHFVVTTRTEPCTLCHLITWQNVFLFILFIFCGSAAQHGLWPPCSRGFVITHVDAPQSVRRLWTSDQLVAETSTWQHTKHTTDKYPYPRWDSNPRSQQVSSHRPVL
jgi:hypothetical protein